MISEKKLYSIWRKHVDSKFLYRVVSNEYLPSIRKNGLEHNKDPFKKNKKDIFNLFKVILGLKKKGFIMMAWWGHPVDQEKIIGCTTKDLKVNYIDFTPDTEDKINYYLTFRGGPLVSTIFLFTEELLLKKPVLKGENWKLIRKLNVWSRKKRRYKSSVIWIKASSKYFETAEFQNFVDKKYVKCPYGSYGHFKKIVSKKGLKYYLPFLTNKRLFHVRTKHKIPAAEIAKVTNKL